MEITPPGLIEELAPRGALRTAINLGNPVLAQKDPVTGELRGVSVALACELARRLAIQAELVAFDSAGKVVEAMAAGALDLVFLAIDPARAGEVLFTAPYVVIEGTYLVRDGSGFRRIPDLDRPGTRIAVGKGAAYDLFLTRTIQHAELVRCTTSSEALERFWCEGLEAAAGVRQPLQRFAHAHVGLSVLDGRFTVIEQALGTAKGRLAARAYLQAFLEEMKSSGFIARSLEGGGQHDIALAPPSATWPEL